MNVLNITNLIDNKVEELKHEIIEFCQALIRIKSISPKGSEKKVAELIVGKLEEEGVNILIKDYFNNRANIIAAFDTPDKSPKLLYNGHMDVVPVPMGEKWKYKIEPFSATIKRGKIWGRGSVDMKGNIAALVMSAIILKKLNVNLKGSLILNFVADEEAGGIHGVKRCLEKYIDLMKADATIIGEPTGITGFPIGIMFGEKGIFWLEITTFGKSAHAAVCELGDNPIYKMLKIINAIKNELLYEKEPKYKFDDYVNMMAEGVGEGNIKRLLKEQPMIRALLNSNTRLTSCLTMINAGEKENQIPEKCQAVFDFRLMVEHNPEILREKIEKIIQNLGFTLRNENNSNLKGDVSLKIRTSDPPSRMDEHKDKLIEVIKESYKTYFNKNAFLSAFPASSDAHYFRNPNEIKDHPKPICRKTVLFGAGDATLSHAANENITISDIIKITKTYALIAYKYLS
ncbi:MAG: M20 family metallopeptidase [Candidatus Helarchaeota archaeon]